MEIIAGENNENNNTVKVYEYYENENEFAIIMELCDENLLDIFTREKSSFSSNKIGEILSQLNNSFKIMNNKKLVHRALNLENILIKYESESKKKLIFKLKLTNDSCFLEDLSKNNMPYNNEPYFKAPEILKKEKIDEKCDLWSLGEIIYVLAFGEYLFSEYEDKKLKQIKNIKNHLNNRTDNSDLDDLIRKLLVEDPKKRLTWDQYFKHPFIRQKGDVKNYYEIEKNKIGQSRFAKIYKAKSKVTNELRAIKIYDIDRIRTEFKRKNFRDATEEDLKPYINGFNNEIKNMITLMGKNKNNNNTVKYYEHFHTNDEFAIVMELCDGNLLDFYINRTNPFNPSKLKEILNLLNNSFTIMNKNNIIHRALNLENILIKYINDGKSKFVVKLKITDDSLVKDLPEIKHNEKVNSNILFISPEILKKEKHIEKCDLWSLGVIIYTLSCKAFPFKGKTESALLKDIQANAKNLQIKTENSDLNDLIKKLLVEDPDIRITWDEYFNHSFFGKKLENFYDLYETIGGPIAETRFAAVYKGKDKKTGELRAIKIFDKTKIKSYLTEFLLHPPTAEEMQPYINSFFNEVKHMKLIQGKDDDNEYTVKVYKSFNKNDEFIIVMELCDDTLLNYLVDKGVLTAEEIYNLLTQLNNSFKRMAENKLVHRALNLENILFKYIDKDKKSFIYKLKITNDSSLIKGLPTIRNSDEIQGFFNYVAPEILNQKEFDEKSDLWSLGVIIYILLFQESPFNGDNAEEILEQIDLNENNLKKVEDENLNDLIKKLLVKDPKNRLTWREYFEHPFFKNSP